MNRYGFTSGVFRDPFDVSRESLDIKVVAVKIGALFLSEIGSACRAFLDVTRTGQEQTTETIEVNTLCCTTNNRKQESIS